MILTKLKYFILGLFLLSSAYVDAQELSTKISGMTLVAPRDKFDKDPTQKLCDINCQWIAVVPYSFTPNDEAKVYFGNHHQWWGETPIGAEETIKMAKANQLKVMLKPQLWVHGNWVGHLEYESEKEWKQWEQGYADYILAFAKIAEENNVEILCIGTELRKSVVQRESFWRSLVEEIRKIYNGKLTYSANWDDYQNMPFWDALDIIGISAYYPLSEKKTPSINELKKEWKKIKNDLKVFSQERGKSILFSEYGYLSVDGCAGKTWELEKKRRDIPANQMAQSNALEALYSTFCDEEFWVGGFLWKWYPNGKVRSGFKDHDYTPQDKVAEETISRWYREFNGKNEGEK